MSWKTENYMKRIYNVFKRSKSQIYPQDIDAFKSVLNELKQHEKSCVVDNILFAKLLTVHLTQNLEYYGSIGVAIKETSKLLSEPLNYHLQILARDLNNKELCNYFESIGLKDWKSKTDKEVNDKIIEDKSSEIYEKIKKNWTFEQVETSLYSSANDFLKDVNNYGF